MVVPVVVVPEVVVPLVVPVVVEPDVVPVVVLPEVVPVVVVPVVVVPVPPFIVPEVVEPEVLPEVEPLVEPAFSDVVQALNRTSDEHRSVPVSTESRLRFIGKGKSGKKKKKASGSLPIR